MYRRMHALPDTVRIFAWCCILARCSDRLTKLDRSGRTNTFKQKETKESYLDTHRYVCLSTYMYVYACVYLGVYLCVNLCAYACMYVCMYVCVYMCMHACLHVSMYTRVYAPCERSP